LANGLHWNAMKFKAVLRLKLAEALLSKSPPILCASIGRVASTAVQQALAHERSKAIFGTSTVPRIFVREAAWELKGIRFRPGGVYVTHDLPYDLIPSPGLKIVFLYGRPSDTVLSLVRRYQTKGSGWMVRHFAHMHANGTYGELLQRDVLRLGEQIDAWPALRGANILGMRYAGLWDNLRILSEFSGLSLTLPPWVERNFLDINPAIVAIARENYREQDMKESRLPDYFLSSQQKEPDAGPIKSTENAGIFAFRPGA
jgi:hypothetical protein